MKTKILNMAIALIGVSATAIGQNKVQEIGGFSTPESVIAKGKYIYVSNMGGVQDPSAKDGDGYISKLSRKDGKLIEEKFITGLNSPKGMYIKGCMLFVADVDKVTAFKLKTKKKHWEADFSSLGVTYLNDITCAGPFSAFVSATDKNTIYKVCANKKIKALKVKGELPGVNGVHRKCGKLYVANYGRGEQPIGSYGKINLCNKKYKALQTMGVYDGISTVCGKILVSDWVSTTNGGGKLVLYKPCKKMYRDIDLGRTINGPSDIYVDKCKKRIWIPAMRENKVLYVSTKVLKKK